MNENTNELALQEENLPTQILSEAIMDIDEMYNTIGKTLAALANTTVDGQSPTGIDADTQAHTHKKYIPDTEIEMLHTHAVPMSDEDLKAFKQTHKRQLSVQYRQQQMKIPAKTLAEITGARIRIAYRLCRYMAHVRGVCQMGEPLIFALRSVNAQVNLFELPMPYDPTVGIYRSLEAVRNLLAQTNELGFEYSYLLDGDIYTTGGMSILPPPLHDGYYPTTQEAWKFRREQFTPEDYEADRDGPLAIYLNICELLVRLLGISETGEDLQGGKTDTYRDIDEQAAVAALLNPKIARLAWPCRDDLETFEEYVLLPYIGRVMVDRAQDSAIEELKRELGLTHLEAFDLIETYKTYAQQANTFDPERERSLAIGKLQKLIEDCANSGMVTTQHNTLKTYLMTLGLTRHDDDSNIDRRAGLENILEAEILRKSEENDSEDATGKLRQIETEEGT